MKAKATALLLADLGVTRSHNRPYVSNDNPFSDIDQAWRLSRISGVAVGFCKRRRSAMPRGRRRSDSLQCDNRLRIGLHQFSATNAGLHHAAA